MKPQALELPFCYHIRASTRATRLRINVSLNHVEVVAPAQVPHHKIHQFVSAHQHWVVTALAKIADKQQSMHALPAPPSAYQNGVAIRYLGVAYPLLIQPTALKKLRIELSDTIIAYVPTTLASADHSAASTTQPIRVGRPPAAPTAASMPYGPPATEANKTAQTPSEPSRRTDACAADGALGDGAPPAAADSRGSTASAAGMAARGV